MPHEDSDFNVLAMFRVPGEILNKIHWVLTKEELVPSFSLRWLLSFSFGLLFSTMLIGFMQNNVGRLMTMA